jgi:hypothetical protein
VKEKKEVKENLIKHKNYNFSLLLLTIFLIETNNEFIIPAEESYFKNDKIKEDARNIQ